MFSGLAKRSFIQLDREVRYCSIIGPHWVGGELELVSLHNNLLPSTRRKPAILLEEHGSLNPTRKVSEKADNFSLWRINVSEAAGLKEITRSPSSQQENWLLCSSEFSWVTEFDSPNLRAEDDLRPHPELLCSRPLVPNIILDSWLDANQTEIGNEYCWPVERMKDIQKMYASSTSHMSMSASDGSAYVRPILPLIGSRSCTSHTGWRWHLHEFSSLRKDRTNAASFYNLHTSSPSKLLSEIIFQLP